MRYRWKPSQRVTRDFGMLVAALLLAFTFTATARAQSLCFRYEDENGRVLSISPTGNIVDFPFLPGTRQVFASPVQEGFSIVYDNDQVAWSFGTEAGNVMPVGCT